MSSRINRSLFFFVAVAAIILQAAQCSAQMANDSMRIDTAKQGAARPKHVAIGTLSASADSTAEDDTAVVAKTPAKWQPNPKKAGLYSAILPGMGQLYNRQYWKIPIVYVGVFAAGYFITNNLDKYRSYRKAYISRINNPGYIDEYTNIYTQDQLQQLQNDYSKYLNLSVLFTGIGFLAQVVDAITSAHLRNFDISRDISMHVSPCVTPYGGVGFGMVMNFKSAGQYGR